MKTTCMFNRLEKLGIMTNRRRMNACKTRAREKFENFRWSGHISHGPKSYRRRMNMLGEGY